MRCRGLATAGAETPRRLPRRAGPLGQSANHTPYVLPPVQDTRRKSGCPSLQPPSSPTPRCSPGLPPKVRRVLPLARSYLRATERSEVLGSPSRLPGSPPGLPEVPSEWYPFSLVEKLYSLPRAAHKRVRRLFSRFFCRPQDVHRSGPSVHRTRSSCPQNAPFSTSRIHSACAQLLRRQWPVSLRRPGRPHQAGPGDQKTGMMSSALMSSETSTPSMSSSGIAGNSIPHRCTMTRILAIALRQFSACSS
jgi:hypothetical protein